MTRVILDPETLSRLGSLDQPLELCDETGHTLGFFRPLADRDLYRELKPLITDEEIARRQQIKDGRELPEIIADLERR